MKKLTSRQQLLSNPSCSLELLKKLKQNVERITMELRQQKQLIKKLKRNAQSDMRRKKLIAYLVHSLKRDDPQYHSQPLTGLPLQVHDERWEVPSNLVEPLRWSMYSFYILVSLILVAWVGSASGLGRCFAELFGSMNGEIIFHLCVLTLVIVCVSRPCLFNSIFVTSSFV